MKITFRTAKNEHKYKKQNVNHEKNPHTHSLEKMRKLKRNEANAIVLFRFSMPNFQQTSNRVAFCTVTDDKRTEGKKFTGLFIFSFEFLISIYFNRI